MKLPNRQTLIGPSSRVKEMAAKFKCFYSGTSIKRGTYSLGIAIVINEAINDLRKICVNCVLAVVQVVHIVWKYKLTDFFQLVGNLFMRFPSNYKITI